MLCLNVEFRKRNERDRKEIRRMTLKTRKGLQEESESVVSHGAERSSTG